jgi:succinate dehydrogenase/fumarate reductase cytochrome b subunit (b558 family)
MSPLTKDNLPSFWRRLHALTGTIPVGAFLLVHLWTNSRALAGARAYDDRWSLAGTTPLFVFLEVVTLHVPLAYHACYGLALVIDGRARSSDESKNTARLIDRASSVAAFAFIVYHVWQFRIPLALGTMRRGDCFPALCDTLSSTTYLGIPLAASLYLIGLAATSYHFAYALARLPATWGIRIPERFGRFTVGASLAVGVIAFLVGARTVLYFATGSKMPGI